MFLSVYILEELRDIVNTAWPPTSSSQVRNCNGCSVHKDIADNNNVIALLRGWG